jgi:hypothetical protein
VPLYVSKEAQASGHGAYDRPGDFAVNKPPSERRPITKIKINLHKKAQL